MAAEQTTIVFLKNEDEMKLMAIFLAELQKQGGEVLITQDGECFKVILLGM